MKEEITLPKEALIQLVLGSITVGTTIEKKPFDVDLPMNKMLAESIIDGFLNPYQAGDFLK